MELFESAVALSLLETYFFACVLQKRDLYFKIKNVKTSSKKTIFWNIWYSRGPYKASELEESFREIKLAPSMLAGVGLKGRKWFLSSWSNRFAGIISLGNRIFWKYFTSFSRDLANLQNLHIKKKKITTFDWGLLEHA